MKIGKFRVYFKVAGLGGSLTYLSIFPIPRGLRVLWAVSFVAFDDPSQLGTKMVTLVLIGNLLIALLCLVTAWQLLQARVMVRGITATLNQVEQDTHNILGEAPNVIIIGQIGVGSLRQNLKKNQGKPSAWDRLKIVLVLLNQAQRIWQFRSGSRRSPQLRSPISGR